MTHIQVNGDPSNRKHTVNMTEEAVKTPIRRERGWGKANPRPRQVQWVSKWAICVASKAIRVTQVFMGHES